MRRLLILVLLLLAGMARGQVTTPGLSGTDFWLTFLRSSESSVCFLDIVSEYDCMAHIENPRAGWDTVVSLVAGRIESVVVPDDQSEPPYGVTLANDGWHVTTTAPAVVYASNFWYMTYDMTSVLPMPNLRCDYMTQTYGKNSSGQEVSIVAPYDSTHLHFVFAEDVMMGSEVFPAYRKGDTLDTMIMRGQVCRLHTRFRQVNASFPDSLLINGFNGMQVHASKPVAVFQGHGCANIPFLFEACDHLYEQCIPSEFWGRNFIVMPTTGRTRDTFDGAIFVGDMARVTAHDDSCVVYVEGQPVKTLNAGQYYTFLLANHSPDPIPEDAPASSWDFYQSNALSVVTSSPAMVCFYITSIGFGGAPGDPSVVVVPPLEQGISRAVVPSYNTGLTNSHYINIVATDPSLMTIDGQSITSSFYPTSTPGYSYARVSIDHGAHVIDADTGRFLATCYGLGQAESYSYIAGMAMRRADYDVFLNRQDICPGDTVTVHVQMDSLHSIDWLVDGQPLPTHGDTLWQAFDSPGLHRIAAVIQPCGDTVWAVVTARPTYTTHAIDTLCLGYSYPWRGMTLTDTGYYVDPQLSVHGCDSTATLQLAAIDCGYDNASLHAARRVICLGDTLTLTATGPRRFHWRAEPRDPSLEGQQGRNPVVVRPTENTVYSLLDDDGNAVASTSVEVETPLVPCVECSREDLDFDYPVITFTDCSEGHHHTRWTFGDGSVYTGERLRRQFRQPLPDSVRVTMSSCAPLGCCVDTTLVLPMLIRAVWLPNVFSPGRPTEGLFAPVFSEGEAEAMTVYDRRGRVMFHSTDAHPAWDGTYDGVACPQGTYMYTLYYHTSRDPRRTVKAVGTVTLLR